MSCSLSVFLRLNFHFIIFSIFIFDTLSLLLLAFASVPSLQVMVLSLSLFQNLSPLYFVFILMFYLFLISQCLSLLPCLIYASCHGWICSDMASRASYYVCLCIICLSTLWCLISASYHVVCLCYHALSSPYDAWSRSEALSQLHIMLFDFVLVFFSSFGCLISASHYVFCFRYVFFLLHYVVCPWYTLLFLQSIILFTFLFLPFPHLILMSILPSLPRLISTFSHVINPDAISPPRVQEFKT